LHARQLRRDFGRGLPADAFRQANVLSEGAVAIQPQDRIVLANVPVAGSALETFAASYVRLRRHAVADFDRGYPLADRDNFAVHLMPENPGRLDALLGPIVPAIDVAVRPAHGRGAYLKNRFAIFRNR